MEQVSPRSATEQTFIITRLIANTKPNKVTRVSMRSNLMTTPKVTNSSLVTLSHYSSARRPDQLTIRSIELSQLRLMLTCSRICSKCKSRITTPIMRATKITNNLKLRTNRGIISRITSHFNILYIKISTHTSSRPI